MSKIISFGEIIWDVYEKNAVIGGAALNFSAHAAKCGQEVYLFSAVGRDDLGQDALEITRKCGVKTDLIRRADRKTGQCLVTLDEKGVPSYDVLCDVAYDHIPVSDEDIAVIKAMMPDALYFGTLIQRSPVSRASLHRLCRECDFHEIICDVNLRKNCYDRVSAEFCLNHATVLKVSEEEEPLLRDMGLYVCDTADRLSVAEAICRQYPQIKHILLTCGEQGCFVYSSETQTSFFQKAKSVTVASTVGAGDSFTAAFIARYLAGAPVEAAVSFGTELSGFVVSRTGAIPPYSVEGDSVIPHFPTLQAHRGVAAEYPENTMSAFRAAVAQGYGYIELDPSYTSDGQIVILHDGKLNRTARNQDGTPLDREIRIHDITYEEALAYDYGVWFAPKFAGEKIPLLSDALCLARKSGVKVKIDNKVERFSNEATEVLHGIISEFEEIIALTSGNPDMIEYYAQKFPKAELHYDGAVDEAVLLRLAPLGERLTVWLPYSSPLTAWVKIPFIDDTLCALVKRHAKLGIWIIGDHQAYSEVCDRYAPDLVETTGIIKPLRGRGLRYDMHVHSQNSHDSQTAVAASAEVCAQKGLTGLAVTDHLDVQHYHGQDISGHITASVREAEDTAEAYAGRLKILRGVEIGEGIWHEDYVKNLLKRQDFDVVLGSVHAVRYKDMHMAYSGIDFSAMSDEDIDGYLRLYFDEVAETILNIPCDILSHLTCPLRYIISKYQRSVDIRKYEAQIESILRQVIKRSLALEVNTSCDAFYMPEEWIIEKYKALGGYIVTIGSDAHVASNMGKGFDQAIQMLKNFGFQHIYYFENRIGIPCEI